ncbi:Hypothetical_protein [Hexamita inflata]|uniref:Hypothetical_protein n=1 Tax=Hexamita inflata TaxID=28002 RepID=A0AA86RFH8_9EUKA|nr:Hypothetical protein HINF_LOCUS64671 [Hexamita inflata]
MSMYKGFVLSMYLDDLAAFLKCIIKSSVYISAFYARGSYPLSNYLGRTTLGLLSLKDLTVLSIFSFVFFSFYYIFNCITESYNLGSQILLLVFYSFCSVFFQVQLSCVVTVSVVILTLIF